jgi:flavin reductase (DIM6/NTAB) family NADH-FMN oxidoreductase RutF
MKKSVGAKTIIFPTPVLIVGTYDSSGKPNLMAAAWGGICCSRPPCVAISLREATYTHGNIVERKAFTINILSESRVKEADYYGIATGRDEDKFAVTGITPVKSELVDAPYGKEFPMVLECNLLHTIEIGLHTQFIGEIMDVKAEVEVLGDNGLPDIEKVKSFLFDSSNRGYYGFGEYLVKAFSIGRELTKK